jgi:hypothetical protein
MEEGRRDYGSNKSNKWFKDLFSKKDKEGVGIVADEEDREVEEKQDAAEKLMALTAIKEEDEADEGKKKEPLMNGNGHCAAMLDEEDTVAQNTTNDQLEKKDIEAKLQDGLMMYLAETEDNEKETTDSDDNEEEIETVTMEKKDDEQEAPKAFNVMKVLGRFMKKMNSEPEEEASQPPSYHEAVVQEAVAPEPSKEESDYNLAAAVETTNASTQVDFGTQVEEDDMAKTDDDQAENALPESEQVAEQEAAANGTEESTPSTTEKTEPESKFKFRFQQFFGDKK